MTITIRAATAAAALLFSTSAFAQASFNQGFETDTSGWTTQTNQVTGQSSTITRTASGTNGISAATGNFYATITNAVNAYSDSGAAGPGYGNAGYTFFGGGNPTYPGSPFRQAVSVYIANGTAAPTVSPNDAAFWIDASPYTQGGTSPNYDAEHNFKLYYNGTTASVGFDGGPSTALGTDGWYTFEFLYSRVGLDASPSTTTLNVLRGSNLVATNTFLNANAPNSTLGGNGYLWFTLFQNGFSGDQLAIDDLQSGVLVDAGVPEPATWGLMLVGFGLVGAGMRARRRSVAFDAA